MTDPLQFLLAVIVLLAVPGPTNAVMAVAGGSNGARAPWPYVAATVAGYAAIIVAARLVLLPLITALPPLGVALRLLVVAYLLFAAWRLWGGARDRAGGEGEIAPLLVFTTTALNPKGLVFALSIFPAAHPMLWAYALAFAVLTVIVGLGWFFAGRMIAAWSGPHARLIPRGGALVLTGFAAYLAWSLSSG
jgi:threonine/homoserine/homoserine lactone efflux protein